MQPLRLRIPGAYWDSQIYSGRLYLFGLDGDLRTVSWDQVISRWPLAPSLKLALVAGFLRSDFLYGAELYAMFQDPEVRQLVERKFTTLSEEALELPSNALESCTLRRQTNPFPFPHSDSEIYNSRIYVAGPSGLVRAPCGRRTKTFVGRTAKYHDVPAVAIAASYGTIAVAAGEDGLFEVPVDGFNASGTGEPRQTATTPCDDCNWTYYSIFGSSSLGNGFLLEYRTTTEDDIRSRELARRTDADELFEHPGYSWGVHDKICAVSNGSLEIVKYRPWEEDGRKRLTRLGQVPAVRGGHDLVSATAAPFGIVVEHADALVLYLSDSTSITLEGEPINWRVFQRSKHYENQLHVQYNDHMEILSFNHDYLLDQDEKLIGTRVRRSGVEGAKPLLRLMRRQE